MYNKPFRKINNFHSVTKAQTYVFRFQTGKSLTSKSFSEITQRTEKCWMIPKPSLTHSLTHCNSLKRLSQNNLNVTYIIDGEFFLHLVIWQQDDIFLCINNRYIAYIAKHFKANVIVL